MISIVDKVKEFMVACGQTTHEFNPDQVALYADLVCEELTECGKELPATAPELKELCDLIWVCIGYGLSCGYDLEGAFNSVYLSNMSKLVDGQCVKDANGKVMKGPNYQPANMEPYDGKRVWVRDCWIPPEFAVATAAYALDDQMLKARSF